MSDRTNHAVKRIISSGEVVLWIEQGTSIHIKAITREGDPVELSEEEARELAAALTEMAAALDT